MNMPTTGSRLREKSLTVKSQSVLIQVIAAGHGGTAALRVIPFRGMKRMSAKPHRRYWRHVLPGVLVLSSCWPPLAVASDDWQPQLVDQHEIRRPDSPITLQLPALPVEVLQNLALELDGIDVTAFVTTQDGRTITVKLPQPLSYARHQLRLVEYARSGDIIERGNWTLDVRRNDWFREASANAQVTVNSQYRFDEKNLAEPLIDEWQHDGSARLEAHVANDGWRSDAWLELVGNHQEALMPREDGKIDLAWFLLTTEQGPWFANVGHQQLGTSNLVMQDFQRRGVALGARTDSTEVNLFSLQTEDISGFQNGLGVSNDDNRTDGVSITAQPFSANSEQLTLNATWLDGKGPTYSGTTTVGDPIVSEGSAASISADSLLLARSVRLRGEYAISDHDLDADGADYDNDGIIDSNLDAEKDVAWAMLAAWYPLQGKTFRDKPVGANIGVEKKRIGTWFRSPANPYAVSDRDLIQGFAGVNWGGLQTQLSGGRETDNLEDDALLPESRLRQYSALLNYSASTQFDDNGQPIMAWYGIPAFGISHIATDQDIVRASPLVAEGALRATRASSASAYFNYLNWSWSLASTLSDERDLTNTTSDVSNLTHQLAASWRFNRYSLDPYVQHSESRYEDLVDQDSTAMIAGIGVGAQFSPRLSAQLGYSYNRQKVDDNSFSVSGYDINSHVSWQWLTAQRLRPGVAFSLLGQYQQRDDKVIDEDIGLYQLMARVTITWAPAY